MPDKTKTSNTVVCNFSTGFYAQGQKRLAESFKRNGYTGDFLFYTDEYPEGCPKHPNSNHHYVPEHNCVPYAFKAYVMKEALDQGYDYIYWCDSSVQLLRPYHELENLLVDKGYVFNKSGWSFGTWSADDPLKALSISREESFGIDLISGYLFGLEVRKYKEFLEQYFNMAEDGRVFKGSWTNRNNECSEDPRVRGHRHDMIALSALAHKAGMNDLQTEFLVIGEADQNEKHFFLLKGV